MAKWGLLIDWGECHPGYHEVIELDCLATCEAVAKEARRLGAVMASPGRLGLALKRQKQAYRDDAACAGKEATNAIPAN